MTYIMICSNVGICFYLLTGVKMYHWEDWYILHLIKHAALLGRTSDLSVVPLSRKVLWCSTVLKQQILLMFELSCCQMFSGHKQNVSKHYCLVWCWPRIHDILLWCIWMQRLLTSNWGWPAVPSIPFIAHELRRVCVPFDRSVSVSFIAEFHFTAPFFNLYLFISAY
jgi:hypothetical protein